MTEVTPSQAETPGGSAEGSGVRAGSGHPAGDDTAHALGVLSHKIADLEDVLAEAVEELAKVRKAVVALEKRSATKKQIKKLKKVLDQLEVVEVGAEGSTPEDSQSGAGKQDEA